MLDDGYNTFANFSGDTNPGTLFNGVKQNTTIFIHREQVKKEAFSTDFTRFYNEYRAALFDNIKYHSGLESEKGYYKIGSKIENSIFSKVVKQTMIGNLFVNSSSHYIYRKSTSSSHYKLFFKEYPYFSINDIIQRASSFSPLYFRSEQEAYTALSVFNSNLFNLWWCSLSDGRNVLLQEIKEFRILPLYNMMSNKLVTLAKDLMKDLNDKSRIVTYDKQAGVTRYAQFSPRDSKHIIDEIDKVLSKHYGFTEEELDFIINYDIKYRMGDELKNGEEEE